MTVYLDKPRNGGCELPVSVHVNLAWAAHERHFDARELARRLGVTETHMKRLQSGKAKPSYSLLLRWAREVGCKVTLSVEREGAQ